MFFTVFDTRLVLISIDCLQFLVSLTEIQVTTKHMLQRTQIRCPRGSDGFVEQVSIGALIWSPVSFMASVCLCYAAHSLHGCT